MSQAPGVHVPAPLNCKSTTLLAAKFEPLCMWANSFFYFSFFIFFSSLLSSYRHAFYLLNQFDFPSAVCKSQIDCCLTIDSYGMPDVELLLGYRKLKIMPLPTFVVGLE